MSRQLLANLPRQSFTGIISAFGKAPDGQFTTALKDVENHRGEIIADHLWVQKQLIPLPKNSKDALGTIISFIADPSEYQHLNHSDKSYSIKPNGLTFEARNVPKELTPKFRRRLLKHKNQYFAGILVNHSLRFVGQGDDGALRLTLRNAYFVESISKLIPIVTPHTFEQPIIVFKAIVYKDTPFLGMLAK